jgi:hypothetical protein
MNDVDSSSIGSGIRGDTNVPREYDPVFGIPALVEDARRNGVKGNLVAARSWYVREHYGASALEAIAQAVPPAARALLDDPPLAMSWCSMGDMMDLDRGILDVAMRGDFERMVHFGAAIAKHDLPTLYRVLFKVGTPAFIMRRIGIACSAYIRGSTLDGETPDANSARVSLVGRPLPRYFCRFGVSGWFRSAVELSGGRRVRVDHVSCRHDGPQEECCWDLAWE